MRCFVCKEPAYSVKGFPIYQPEGDEGIFVDYLATPHCRKNDCTKSAELEVLKASRKKIVGTGKVFYQCCRKVEKKVSSISVPGVVQDIAVKNAHVRIGMSTKRCVS